MTCSACFNFQSEGSISALEHCKKIKFSIFVHHTLVYSTQILNNVTLE